MRRYLAKKKSSTSAVGDFLFGRCVLDLSSMTMTRTSQCIPCSPSVQISTSIRFRVGHLTHRDIQLTLDTTTSRRFSRKRMLVKYSILSPSIPSSSPYETRLRIGNKRGKEYASAHTGRLSPGRNGQSNPTESPVLTTKYAFRLHGRCYYPRFRWEYLIQSAINLGHL